MRRGLDPELRRQHVHEGGDAHGDAHGGGGRVPALHVSESVRAADGHHVARLGRHPAPGAGRQPRQTHRQLRYRIRLPPPPPPPPSGCTGSSVYLSLSVPHPFLFSFSFPFLLTHVYNRRGFCVSAWTTRLRLNAFDLIFNTTI